MDEKVITTNGDRFNKPNNQEIVENSKNLFR